jgi:hypothetical protein
MEKQKHAITREYLKEYSKGLPILNSKEEDASKVFSGAIAYAVTVFVTKMFLGGHYKDTKNCEEISECLNKLNYLITK